MAALREATRACRASYSSTAGSHGRTGRGPVMKNGHAESDRPYERTAPMAHITRIPVPHCAVPPPAAPPPGSQLLRKPIAHQSTPRSTTGAPTRHAMVAELTGLWNLGPAPARGRAASGESVARTTEPTDFAALPDALHESIAMRLAPRDLAMLACTNHNLRDTLWPMSTSHRIVAQAAGTHDLAALRTTFQATLALEDGPPLPAAARAALAAWIEHIPSMQMEAFRKYLGTCAPMQPGAQAAALTALGPALARLPMDRRDEACQHLLDAIGTLPAQHGMEPLRAVASQLATLPVAKREAAFEALLQLAVRAAPGLQGTVLEALTGQIKNMPADARLHSFQKLLNAADDAQLDRIVIQLGPVIAHLPRGARPAAFHSLQLSTTRIPQGQHGSSSHV